MKAQSKKHLLIGSTALATAIAGSSAMAAGNANPFASESTHTGTLKTAEMACGAGQCGGNMDEEKKDEEKESDS